MLPIHAGIDGVIAEMSADPENSLRLKLWLNLITFTGNFLVCIEVGGLSSALFFDKIFLVVQGWACLKIGEVGFVMPVVGMHMPLVSHPGINNTYTKEGGNHTQEPILDYPVFL